MAETVRLDKWLWAARFFKTRSLAVKAIEGGKVRVEGGRAKPGRALRAGQHLEIRIGPEVYQVEVQKLCEKRGPASVARTLYLESEDSRERREQAAVERRAAARAEPDFGGRPDKYQRRRIRKLLGR